MTYTIVVANAGPSAAPTVGVLDLFAATLASCATTCVGAGGGSCTAGPVVGNLNETANLPVGGSATYTATCTVSPTATGTLVNTATATVNGGGTDPNTSNNSATDTDTCGRHARSSTVSRAATPRGGRRPCRSPSRSTPRSRSPPEAREAAFAYDFATVKPGEAFAATSIAVATDAAGRAALRPRGAPPRTRTAHSS